MQVLAGRVTDGIAIAVGSSALFLLVVTRMAQLLREVELQARKVRDLARRDELRAAEPAGVERRAAPGPGTGPT